MMEPSDDPHGRALHDLANRLLAVAGHLETIAASGDEQTRRIATEALGEVGAARSILHLLTGASDAASGATDLTALLRQAETSGAVRVRRGDNPGSRVALGAAAVHAVLESVLRCERTNEPTVSAVAVGNRARVTVESSADPFSDEERDRLLDPLRLRNPESLGAGLAFAACAEILRRAGGEFTMGGGARRSYSIEIPLATPSRSPAPRVILVVDDEESVRESIGILLRHLGHRAELAGDVTTAERLLGRPGLEGVLVDLHLGNGSGAETLVQKIAARHPMLLARTVVSTGDPAGAAAAERLGVRLLAKPFGIEELRALFG